MPRVLRNVRLWLALAVVGGLVAVAVWPKTLAVDTAVVGRGPLMTTIDEEGRTRVRSRFVVATPVAGHVRRVELEPGDVVKAGQVVARVQPDQAPLLDARTRAQAEAALESARAAVGRARADEQRARAALQQAERELARTRSLVAESLATPQQLEAREADVRAGGEQVNAAAFAVRAAEADVVRAEVALAPATRAPRGGVVAVTAPVDGVVLKRVRESESVVPAGDPLVELGDPRQLEIVVDLLSVDAVRVEPGARVLVEQWGGGQALEARVRRIEPSGFTKVSALGVEEQRVNVILDLVRAGGESARLGDGYRVEARVVTWEAADVVKVPTGALMRAGDAWAVFVLRDGRAVQQQVTIGHQNGREAELTGGLEAGATIVLHPGDTLVNGARVAPRATR